MSMPFINRYLLSLMVFRMWYLLSSNLKYQLGMASGFLMTVFISSYSVSPKSAETNLEVKGRSNWGWRRLALPRVLTKREASINYYS